MKCGKFTNSKENVKNGVVKKLAFFTAHFKGIGKNDAERTNRAKKARLFCLPEGVQRYVEWRGLFVA